MALEEVTKSGAAARQLRAAIRLYFQDGDTLAVHTIAGAAHGVLCNLSKRRIAPQAAAESSSLTHPDFVATMVNKAKNFLKHADRDPDERLIFNSDWTDFLLYEAISLHLPVVRTLPLEHGLFLIWIVSKHPSVRLDFIEKLPGNALSDLRQQFPSLRDQKGAFLAALNHQAGTPQKLNG
jgi:hypothetical protein